MKAIRWAVVTATVVGVLVAAGILIGVYFRPESGTETKNIELPVDTTLVDSAQSRSVSLKEFSSLDLNNQTAWLDGDSELLVIHYQGSDKNGKIYTTVKTVKDAASNFQEIRSYNLDESTGKVTFRVTPDWFWVIFTDFVIGFVAFFAAIFLGIGSYNLLGRFIKNDFNQSSQAAK